MCEVEKASGVILFNFTSVVTVQAHSKFNIQTIWAQIAAVPSPGPLPAIPLTSTFNVCVSERAAKIRRMRQFRRVGIVSLFVFGFLIAIGVGGAATFWISVGVVIVAYAISRAGDGQVAVDIRKNVEDAQARLKTIEEHWVKDAGPDRFDSRFRELEEKKNRYGGLEQLRQRRLRQLHTQVRDRQMQRLLNQHRILDAEIPGIGPARVAALQSFGTETAADVTEADVLMVPGFGQVRTRSLVD